MRMLRLTLIGENAAQCEHWLTNFWGEPKQLIPEKALFVWLNSPIPAQSIPKTSKDAGRFIKDLSNESYNMLINTIPSLPGDIPVVFGLQIDNQPVVAGFWLKEPNSSVQVRRVNGFRSTAMCLRR